MGLKLWNKNPVGLGCCSNPCNQDCILEHKDRPNKFEPVELGISFLLVYPDSYSCWSSLHSVLLTVRRSLADSWSTMICNWANLGPKSHCCHHPFFPNLFWSHDPYPLEGPSCLYLFETCSFLWRNPYP